MDTPPPHTTSPHRKVAEPPSVCLHPLHFLCIARHAPSLQLRTAAGRKCTLPLIKADALIAVDINSLGRGQGGNFGTSLAQVQKTSSIQANIGAKIALPNTCL